MSNLFRMTYNGKLDRQYLRICAVYRLLRKGVITRERAIELLVERGVAKASQTVSLWLDQRSFRHHWSKA